MATTSTTYRVYQISKALKLEVAADRISQDMNQQDHLQLVVDDHLDGLVETLLGLGIQAGKQCGPARYPMTDKSLAALRKASARTGVPACDLLMACLHQTTEAREATRKPSRKKAAVKAKGSQRKATKRTRKAGVK